MPVRMTELNRNEILIYLGYRDHVITDEVREQIENCVGQVEKCVDPKLVYRRVQLTEGSTTEFELMGNDIHELLKNCSEAVFCAVTLGAEIEKLLIRKEVTNMADALIMDACASVAVENVINNFEADLREEMKSQGKFVTSRYSPGYGDLPLACQINWCSRLDTRKRIGLHVTSDYIMIPRKSVTAVMGISEKPVELRKAGCESCNIFFNCEIRKKGRCCHE